MSIACRLPLFLLPVLACAVGCSGVTFREVTDTSTNGIRYYRPATYLLIKPDYDKQSAKLEWVTLADTSKGYAADPHAFMATNTTELQFQKGLLKKVESEANSTAVPKALIAALDELAKSALETAAKAATAAAGFTVSRQPRGSVAAPPERAIFLFKIEDGPQGTVVRQLYPPPATGGRS